MSGSVSGGGKGVTRSQDYSGVRIGPSPFGLRKTTLSGE